MIRVLLDAWLARVIEWCIGGMTPEGVRLLRAALSDTEARP